MVKKNLVCILAETRAHKLTWINFKKNLLDAINADLALCISVTDSYDYINPFWQHAKFKWDAPEYEDWGLAYDIAQIEIAKQNNRKIEQNWRKLIKIKDQWLGGVRGEGQHAGSAGILIFFRWLLLQNIVNEGLDTKYERFVITRSDFIWENEHPNLNLLDSKYIWIPDGEGYDGVTDRHVVLDQKSLHVYLNLLENILLQPDMLYENMHHKIDWNLERFIKYHLMTSDYKNKIKFFPYCMYSVREWRGSSSWSFGVWSDQMGYYIKYQNEFESSRAIKERLAFNSWEDILFKPGGSGFNSYLKYENKYIVFNNENIIGLDSNEIQSSHIGLVLDDYVDYSKLFYNKINLGDFDRIFFDDVFLLKTNDNTFQMKSKKDGLFYVMSSENILIKAIEYGSLFSTANRYL